jgi:hypothetical protein
MMRMTEVLVVSMKRRRRSVLTWTPCLSVFLVLLLVGLFVGRVSAQTSHLDENVLIKISADSGTVEVSSSEYYFPVNDTSPVHTPSGVNVTNMNQSDVKDVTLTFSTSNSTIVVWALNTNAARTIGDAWGTMLSTGFQTSFVYDYGPIYDFVNYKAAGKSNLAQYMQSLLSWCSVADLNGFSSTLVQIAGKPGAYITVEITPSSNNDWSFKIKSVYDTTMPTGSGAHTIDVLSLLGVTSLAPSAYSGYYDSTYLATVYLASVDVSIISSQTVGYASSQPAGLSTVEPSPGVLAPRGWHDYGGAGPDFEFENDSSAANQLSYTFNGSVVPEFSPSAIVSLFMVISMAAILATRRFHGRITSQD